MGRIGFQEIENGFGTQPAMAGVKLDLKLGIIHSDSVIFMIIHVYSCGF